MHNLPETAEQEYYHYLFGKFYEEIEEGRFLFLYAEICRSDRCECKDVIYLFYEFFLKIYYTFLQ